MRNAKDRSPRSRAARTRAAEEAPAAPVAPSIPAQDLTPVVGANLRRLRMKHELSLERLSKVSGVSRAMLGQIELGQSTPTINILWKISTALGVPYSALLGHRPSGGMAVLRSENAKLLTSHDGRFTSRALFPFDEPRRVEFYELHLAPRSEEVADAHAPGTTENLVVSKGSIEIDVEGRVEALSRGDAIVFEADVPHRYRNVGDEDAIMYLVMTYAESVG